MSMIRVHLDLQQCWTTHFWVRCPRFFSRPRLSGLVGGWGDVVEQARKHASTARYPRADLTPFRDIAESVSSKRGGEIVALPHAISRQAFECREIVDSQIPKGSAIPLAATEGR